MKDGNFNDSLSNYYDDFFKLKLISKNEPIILMGPSSYKTELAKFYIKNENPSIYDNFNIIYLNQKTTIEELLGSPNFFSSKESKYFNLDLLCEISHLKLDHEKKKNILETHSEINYFKERIKKYKTNPIITEIIDNIYNKMINNTNKNEKPTIEFEPGSILLSILRQESLIFKNIHQVSTEVFERFNELFGTEGILSLNEDIYQTFFSENKKEQFKQIIKLEEFNNNSIIFIGTCPENSFQSLSETILSRFSLICVEEHEDSEKEKIIKKLSRLCHGISETYINSIIKNFKFGKLKDIKKIKNLLNIFSKMNKNNSNESKIPSKIIDNNFGYINSYIQLNSKSLEIDPLYKSKENILYYYNDYIYSKASKLRIKTENQPKMETKKKFTPLFNILVDLIHFGICTFTPLILECSPGQGKQTSINYVCELLNYEIENIVITNTFTVKDLFKKTMIKPTDKDNIELIQITTKLFNKINNINEDSNNNFYDNNDKSRKNEKKIMFVFHNINNAESDVLSKLSEIFNREYDNSNYALIGLININESLIDRETYYHNLFHKALYYKIPPLTYLNIGGELICNLNSVNDYYSESQNANNIFTLNDISKFKKLKEVSKIDDSFLEDIIFKNKLLTYNNEQKQLNKNKILSKLNKCDFNYLNNTKEFIMEVNSKSFSIMAEEKLKNFEEEKNTLSYEQKKCLIFLGLSVKSNISCIIQGSTGVGKSHLIKLFAKFLGKKLHIFELNKDNQISLLTKCFIFNVYDEEEKNDIDFTLKEIEENQNNNQIDMDKRYSLIKNNYENLNEDKKKLFLNLKSKYSLIKRFKYINSAFLDAVINGEWVLLDGIENSPSFIAEKIALLCGENPELNLYEKDMEPIRPKKGFHLFITYNPERVNNNNIIPNSLLDKCLIYNLDSFAKERINISQIIHGFLVNSLSAKNLDILYDIASRLSNIHFIIKENLNKNNYNEITERTIINFCKTIRKENDNLYANIKENYLYFYFPSLEKKEREYYFKLINENITKKGTQFEALATHFRIECKELLSLLSSYTENDLKDENEYQIFFAQFLNHFLNIPFKYINELKSSISGAIAKIKNNNLKNNKFILIMFIDYINKINNNLEVNNENLNNDIFREKINEFPSIKKLIVYEELNKNNLILWNWMNSLNENINIFRQIEEMHKFQSIDSLHKFLEILSNSIPLVQNIIKIFPFSNFQKTNFSTINPILKYIIQNSSINKINFKIKLENKIYDFKYQDKDNEKFKLILHLKLNNNNKLLISEKTEVNGKDFSRFKERYNEEQINNFNLKFLKLVFSDNEIKNRNMNQYYKNAKINIDEEIDLIIENFSLNSFFDKNGNIILYSWSILFINNKQLIDHYLPYFLNCGNDKNNIENNIFYLTILLYNKSCDKDFNKIKVSILEISNLVSQIINKENYLYNLSFDENYIINMNLKTTKEIEQVIKNLDVELDKVNKIIHMIKILGKAFPAFINYSKTLMEEKNRLINEKNKIRNDNYKKSIKEKIGKEMNYDKDLIENLKKKLDEINDFEELKEFDELIDNYIIRYCNRDELNEIKIFYKDNIISLEDYKNENIQLIELLLKYSKIRDLIEEIKNNRETQLISIQKIFELIDKKYFDFFLSILFVNVQNGKLNLDKNCTLESTLYSIFVKEIVDKELIQNFIEFPNLVNNLYDVKHSKEINNEWCWNIEKRYHFNTKIYIPEINNLSFLYLFIRIKDFESNKLIKGILIDEEVDDLFDYFKRNFEELNLLRDKNQIKDLILKIGNLIFSFYFKEKVDDYDSLTKKINEKLNLNSTNDKVKFLLGQFLKYKYLYKNIKNEKLIFDELIIDNEKDHSKLFTSKYPSLINFLNNNYQIYYNLVKELSILGDYPKNQTSQFIPLWLLCLKVLSNISNIKVSFNNIEKEIISIELELGNRIKNKIKNKIPYYNLDWILLISENTTHLIENEFSERFYSFFNYLLSSISNLSEKSSKEIILIIKEFIFNIFDITYEKGIEYVLRENKEIFDLPENLTKRMKELIKNEFNFILKGNNLKSLISELKDSLYSNNKDSLSILKDKFEQNINKFENLCNEKNRKKFFDISYNILEKNCSEYNKTINNYEKLILQDRIQENLSSKDAFYENSDKGKVKWITKNEFIQKYKDIKLKENKISFNKGKIKKEAFLNMLNKIINKLKEFDTLLKQLTLTNIEKNFSELIQFKDIFNEEYQIYYINKNDYEDIAIKNNIDLNEELNTIISKIKVILDRINILTKDYSSFKLYLEDNFYLSQMKKEIEIYIPKKDNNYYSDQMENNEILINKDIKIIPYFMINEDNIVGNDEFEYNLGILSLYDLKIQNIYFSLLDDNIDVQLNEEYKEFKLIKKNKLYLFQIEIPEKKKKKLNCLLKKFYLIYPIKT